ncbi:MAG TPA: hypothetical protein VGK38_01670 [Prolixibacteraceae bacterium]|jgi:hypothetical protein
MSKLIKIWSRAATLILALFLFLPTLCLPGEIYKSEIPVTCPSSSDKALQSFLNGREAFEMGRINDAIIQFDKAIKDDPQFALAYLYKNYTANSEKDRKYNLDMAVKNRNNVSEGEKIMIDMESALSEKNFENRYALARHLVELYPASLRAKLILAEECQARKEYTKFRDLATEVIMLEPDSPLGYRMLASSYLFNEPLDFLLARKYMQKFVELRPNEPTGYIALGDVNRAILSFKDAEIAYSKAIELDPNNDVVYAKRGYANVYLGLFDEGRNDWNMSNKLAKESSKTSTLNYCVSSFLYPWSGKSPAESACQITQISNGRKSGIHPMEAPEDDHYFCCTVVSMKHGLYVSPYGKVDEHEALKRELAKESKAPDPRMIEADITFLQSFNALSLNDFKLATQKAEEHARLVEPFLNPRKLEIYNFLMGSIDLKQKNYSKAIAHYQKSDTNNVCIKYEMGLAYDGLGEWDAAESMFKDVASCNFVTAIKPYAFKISKGWLDTYAAVKPQQEQF